jgi:hypothetical protein
MESPDLFTYIMYAAVGALGAMLFSFFQEKGKNLATKKDIQEITQKVESIKSDLEILTHKKISLADEKKKVLLNYNSAFNAWLDYVVSVPFSNIYKSEKDNSAAVILKMDTKYFKVKASYAKLRLYYTDDSLLSKLQDQTYKVIKLSEAVSVSLIEVSTKEEVVSIFENEYKTHLIPALKEQVDQARKELISMVETKNEERIKLYTEVLPLNMEVSNIIAEKLNQI